MEKDPIKQVQFLVSRFMDELVTVTLENRAYKLVIANCGMTLDDEVAEMLSSSRFGPVRQKCNALKQQVFRAAKRHDNSEIFGSLGELLGMLRQA